MSKFTGRQYKGAMKEYRERKRREAKAREDSMQYRACGHNHVPNVVCRAA